MSLSHSHRFDLVAHPIFEPEVRRAILAAWAANSRVPADRRTIRPSDRGERTDDVPGTRG